MEKGWERDGKGMGAGWEQGGGSRVEAEWEQNGSRMGAEWKHTVSWALCRHTNPCLTVLTVISRACRHSGQAAPIQGVTFPVERGALLCVSPMGCSSLHIPRGEIRRWT